MLKYYVLVCLKIKKYKWKYKWNDPTLNIYKKIAWIVIYAYDQRTNAQPTWY